MAATTRTKSKKPAAGKRKPAAKKRAPARKRPPQARATRSLMASRPSLRGLLELEPHEVDIIALALIAIGIFLGGIAYFGWAGGSIGRGLMGALRLLVGAPAYTIPVVLVIGGVLILGRELRPPKRPLRTGAICLAVALLLAFAAGTFGLGHGAATSGFWSAAAVKPRGGYAGALLFWIAGHLFSTAGADILAIFLALAGVLLLSGATFASFVLAARRHAVAAMRRAETSQATRRAATHAARDPEYPEDLEGPEDPPDPGARELPEPLVVPEWTEPDTTEFVVTATHVEAPAIGEPDFTDDDEEEPGQLQFEGIEVPPEGPEDDYDDDDPEAGDNTGPRPNVEIGDGDLTPQGRYRASVTEDPEFVWRVPGARFLTRSTGEAAKPDTAGQAQVAAALVEALGHFGVEAKVIGKTTGPHITRYELKLAPGIKVSKVANLKDDLAYALAATDIRILAPIPGKTAVGVEVPNARRRIVHLGDVHQEAPADWSPLTVWLGKDISGKAIGADLAKMPHLLVAGTTGAGKSACVNAMLSSILLRATPHEVRLVLVDPKQVELNHYESIPHLLTPVITSPRMAANALQNLVKEMELRYGMMALARARKLTELNAVRERRGEPALPYVLCVIDELADLMMVAPADVEDSIIRLAQKARAVGIHLVLATQSPRVDVITGMIKANVPSRIAFAVSSQTDSRVILDQGGAESLLGQGDMLFSPVGSSKLQRIQGAFIDETQIAELTEAWRRQGEPELHEELLEEVEEEPADTGEKDDFDPDEDPLLEEAISLVAQMGTASTSMLQRRLRLGYTRAGRLIDMLERRGIISGYEGSKPRQVLITESDLPRILTSGTEANDGAARRINPGGPTSAATSAAEVTPGGGGAGPEASDAGPEAGLPEAEAAPPEGIEPDSDF